MNRNYLKITSFMILLSVLALGIWSCTKDQIAPADGSRDLVVSEMVQHLLDKGYELDDIKEFGEYYLVQGDLYYPKNMEMDAPQTSQKNFHSDYLVNGNYIGNGNVIRIYSELPGPSGFGTVGNTWDEAVDEAIAAWNGIPNACVIFQRTTNQSQAHINVVDGAAKPLGSTQFGWAGTPSAAGAPFHTVWINMQYPNGPATYNAPIANTTMVQKRNIIAHELGHCIGLRHSNLTSGNAIPGTGGFDANSLMRDNLAFEFNTTVFSVYDEIAVRWLYGSGDCTGNNPPSTSIDLAAISPFCYPQTFSASGTYSTSGSGAVDIDLQVSEITGGLSFFQTIASGQFTSGTFSFPNIDLDNIPGFTFNSSNPYLVRAVMTSPGSVTSADQNLPYDDCSPDPCEGKCAGLSNAIQTTNNGFGSYTFSVDPAIVNDPCAASFTYEWQLSGSPFTSSGPSYTVSLSPGSQTIALFIINSGGRCYKETVHLTI